MGTGGIEGIGGFGGRRLAAACGRVAAWSWGLHHLPASQASDVAHELRDLGYPMVWIPEIVGSKEILSHAGLLLSAGPDQIVGTGIASIYARDPMAMANGARTLGEAHPGRFVLGIGVSSERSVTRRGGTYGPPLATMQAYLDAMAAAAYAGPEPDPPVPLVLAAVGPRMLELAAERADGAHPFFVPVEHTADARRILGPEPWLAVAVPIVMVAEATEARRIARSFAGHYFELPHHRANLERYGFGEADLAGHGSDRVIDTIVAWGSVDAIANRVRAHLEAGADQVALMLRTEPPSDSGLAAWRELAAALLEPGARAV
jgi:probable F420-dependent oxidoreductase